VNTAPVVTPEQAAQELLRRRAAEESFYEFFKQAWPVMVPGYAYIDSWHVKAICDHMEALFNGEILRFLLNMPPRSLKTTICDVAFPAWAWIKRPSEKFLYGSYAYNVSEDASIKCRALINSRWFQARWGSRWRITDDRDTKEYYANTEGGERIITSVDGTLTGRGCDIFVANDPNNTKDQSAVVLENALRWWTTVVPTRLNDPKTGRMMVVQQRTHERDISGFIISNDKRKQWVKLILPLEFEIARRCVTVPLKSTGGKPWRDPRTKEGEPLIVERMGPEEIASLKESLGSEYAISGQLQQRPAPADGGIIKKKWFQLWKQAAPPKLEYKVLSIDTALSEKKAAAYNAATTWGVFKDMNGIPNVILLAVWRKRCEYPELRERIARLAVDYLDDGELPSGKKRPPDMILIEAKVSGISLVQDLARMNILATRFKPDKYGDKLERVRRVTPLLEGGRVWVPAQPPTFERMRSFADVFVEQAGTFPNSESRDLVDTMTQALLRLWESAFVWHPADTAPEDPVDSRYERQRAGAIY
jgi:predicted phage terminase large subunit-like protein